MFYAILQMIRMVQMCPFLRLKYKLHRVVWINVQYIVGSVLTKLYSRRIHIPIEIQDKHITPRKLPLGFPHNNRLPLSPCNYFLCITSFQVSKLLFYKIRLAVFYLSSCRSSFFFFLATNSFCEVQVVCSLLKI